MIGKPEVLDLEGAPFDDLALLMEVVGPRPYPIIAHLDCGHTNPMLTIAQGTPLRVDAPALAQQAEITVLAPMVEGGVDVAL